MTRVLTLGMAAILAGNAAVSAEAASNVNFTGYYRVHYMNAVNVGHQSSDRAFTDSYFQHRLNFDVEFTATDELSFFWRFRAPNSTNDTRWGTPAKSAAITSMYYFGRITQDWGTLYIGRLAEYMDEFGLVSLGWSVVQDPYFFVKMCPFDGGEYLDAVMFDTKSDNGLGLKALYTRLTPPTDTRNDYSSDRDWDRYFVEGRYQWTTGGAALGVKFDRNATFEGHKGFDKAKLWHVNPSFMQNWGDFGLHMEGLFGWGKTERTDNRARDFNARGQAFYVDVNYNYDKGNVLMSGWWVSGTDQDRDPADYSARSKSLVNMGLSFRPLIVANQASSYGWNRIDATGRGWVNQDAVGVANNAFVNFIQNAYSPATGSASVPFLSGGVQAGLDGLAGGVWDGTGANVSFQDALGAYFSGTGVVDRRRSSTFNNNTAANHWAVALVGKHSFTPEITMNYAVGYLALNHPNYRIVDQARWDVGTGAINQARYAEQKKDLGLELDLGFSFQLLDNLRFSSLFGYMFTGDAYKTLKGFTYANNHGEGDIKAVWADGDDSYVWYNVLQFNF